MDQREKQKMTIHTVAESNFTPYKDYIKCIAPLFFLIKCNLTLIMNFLRFFFFSFFFFLQKQTPPQS